MKMQKKLVAVALSLIMMLTLSSMVFASSEGEIDGDGSTVITDLKVHAVTLPTGKALDFTLDPQGLASATYTDGKIEVGSLVPNENIIEKNKNGALLVNLSSYPVLVTVSAKLTGDAVAVADETALKADDKNNVLFWINTSTAMTDSTTETTEFAGTVKAIDALGETDKSAYVALKPAAYEVTQAGTAPDFTYSIAIKADEKGDGTKFQVGGQINLKADWTDFAKTEDPSKVGVSVKFTVTELDATADAADTDNHITGAYGLVDTEKADIDAGEPAALGFASESVTGLTANTALSVPFNFGEFEIKNVTANGSAFSGYTAKADAIEFTFGSTSNKTIVVTLTNDVKYTVVLKA